VFAATFFRQELMLALVFGFGLWSLVLAFGLWFWSLVFGLCASGLLLSAFLPSAFCLLPSAL
jgi:hypothetical protein